jgi:hypothetical protein
MRSSITIDQGGGLYRLPIARRLAGGLTRLFGCWHTRMSRPFTRDGETYCACLGCGARRRFDLQAWRMRGPYYYHRLPGVAAKRAAPAKKERWGGVGENSFTNGLHPA